MKTIAIINDKGGVGKTTVTVNLAAEAEALGMATAIFDLDPRANSTVWGDIRANEFPQVVPAQKPRLGRLIEQARQNDAALVIIDTPGNDLGIAEAAASNADIVLIPCRPYGPDLISLAATVKVVLATGKPSFVVINSAPHEGPQTAEAIASLKGQGVEVCPVILHTRKDFVSRFHEGLAARETDPKGKAAAETKALLLWACEKVAMLPNTQVTKLDKQLA